MSLWRVPYYALVTLHTVQTLDLCFALVTVKQKQRFIFCVARHKGIRARRHKAAYVATDTGPYMPGLTCKHYGQKKKILTHMAKEKQNLEQTLTSCPPLDIKWCVPLGHYAYAWIQTCYKACTIVLYSVSQNNGDKKVGIHHKSQTNQ